MAMVINGQVDLTIGMYTVTFLRDRYMSSSEFYFSVAFVLIVPPGNVFSSLEKLFRPFQTNVWLMMVLAFAVGSFVITIVKLQTNRIKNFVFGSQNKSPYMNALNALLGGSLHILPKQNFARSLLFMYLLFSLVNRTLYQGALFQFLQADDRQKSIQSIDELMETDFLVYVLPSTMELTQNMKFRDKRIEVNSTVIDKKREEIIEPSSKVVLASSLDRVAYLNMLSYKNYTLTICKEYLFTFNYGIYFRKNSYLRSVFNRKISMLRNTGLIQFWASQSINSDFLKIRIVSSSPRQLNIEQLFGSFKILLCGLLASGTIFFLEILSNCLHIKSLQALIEFFI